MSWRERRRNSLFLSPAPRSPDPDDLPWRRQVTFLIAGQSKRAIVNEILRSDADSFKYPAARVSPSDGQLTWLITADAMGNLPIR